MEMEHVIRRYVRNPKTKTLDGMIIAAKIDGVVQIAASKVRNGSGDVFNKVHGFEIAKDRLFCLSKGRTVKIPASFAGELPTFVDRCKYYYKTEDVAMPLVDTFRHD